MAGSTASASISRPTLGRGPDGFDPNAPFFKALAEDPLLSRARLIAEPWDVGPGGYQLGAFGPDFAEWNDRFRDAARRFWRGDPGVRGEIATRMAGSRDVFPRAAAPSKGVNFVVAHDGFTLADLMAYERKHNEANGEGNRDGTDANFSWNHGVEGPSEDPAIARRRARDQRNLLTLLFASRGTPMLAMGSELGFSQGGNNNAYAQDNATTAIDWSGADAFADRLHSAARGDPPRPPCPVARRLPDRGAVRPGCGLPDVEWRDAEGPLTPSRWNEPAGAVLVAVFAAPHGDGVDRVAVAMNRAIRTWSSRFRRRAPAWAGGRSSTADRPDAPERPVGLADRRRLGARSWLILAESPLANMGLSGGPPSAETIDALASAVGIAAEWWDVGGKRTIVSPETKIALLTALGLGGRQRSAGARKPGQSSTRRAGAASPASLVLRVDEPLVRPCATAAGLRGRIECEDGKVLEWRVDAGDGAQSDPARRPHGRRATGPAARPADRPSSAHRRRRRVRTARSRRRRPIVPRRRTGSASASPRNSTRCGARAIRASATFRRWRWPARRRAARGRPISASARCTCCSRATASGRAPIIRPTGAFSTRS